MCGGHRQRAADRRWDDARHVRRGCAKAVADGTYPTVFNNDTADGSFGITSPIFLDNITTRRLRLRHARYSHAIRSSPASVRSPKSALNLSLDGKSITFVGYRGGPGFLTAPNQFDVSNSNTPGVIDPSNPVGLAVLPLRWRKWMPTATCMITEGNAYSGNNGRAAIKGDSLYYMAGNDNNGGLSKTQLDHHTGRRRISFVPPAPNFWFPARRRRVPPNITMIGDFEITQVTTRYGNSTRPPISRAKTIISAA